ncbi:hypothetical protein N9P29_01010 [bacterium]|nr:hypothetical protein [bacterium]
MAKRQLSSRVHSLYAKADMILEAPAIIEESSGGVADLSGIAAQYNFEYAISLDSTGDFTRVALGTLDFDAEIEARAVPLNNTTAIAWRYLPTPVANAFYQLKRAYMSMVG